MSLHLGEFELHSISGGRLRIDGGAMFGAVPRVVWERKAPTDERNRIQMDTNCLLIRTPPSEKAGSGGGKLILVDTGYGSKRSDRERDNFALESGNPLLEHLASAGVLPEQIDVVVLTHLHFDHAGGSTILDDSGQLRPTFPCARHLVQRVEWEDATSGLLELRGAYFEQDFVPLQQAGAVDFVEGDTQVAPGVSVRLTGGHTRGHQVIVLESAGNTALYPCDLCPTAAHLRPLWNMGFDQCMVQTRRAKAEWTGRAADEDWVVIFAHDPKIRAACLARHPKEEFVVREVVNL